VFTGTDDVWGNGVGTNRETGCVDGLYAVQREWVMLSTWLGRNGIKGSGSGVYLAPSTRVANDYGFLVTASKFTSDANAPSNTISLGRSWDQGGVSPTPNGQAVVRESILGAHISKKAPWAAAATSGRAFSATGNRFSEYCNSGPGAGP